MKKFKKIAPAILITVITLGFSFPFAKNAEAAKSYFGGVIVTFIPKIPDMCQIPHTLMYDYESKTPFGVYTSGSSTIYPPFNLGVSGKFLLGEREAAPVTCLLPYPLYLITRVGTS